ncbi:MAG: ABC transporter ATP-binding protein [Desulfobacterales bacterium]|nr:ABC transporter ATP-binding protein [Desulfobacterales bacterium]
MNQPSETIQNQESLLSLSDVYKTYIQGNNRIPVLQGVNLNVKPGEMLAIMGSSGSGKSTLLNIIGLLDDYDRGEYRLNGRLMGRMSESKAAVLRNRYLGFVFQSFHLIPFKTALENVALPLFFQKIPRKKRDCRAMEFLERFGLSQWADHRPNELSGGQKQRVAIARAMIADPKLILADEPTGALDNTTSLEVMKIFKEINTQGITLIVITHEKEIAAMTDRIVYLDDGVIKTGR